MLAECHSYCGGDEACCGELVTAHRPCSHARGRARGRADCTPSVVTYGLTSMEWSVDGVDAVATVRTLSLRSMSPSPSASPGPSPAAEGTEDTAQTANGAAVAGAAGTAGAVEVPTTSEVPILSRGEADVDTDEDAVDAADGRSTGAGTGAGRNPEPDAGNAEAEEGTFEEAVTKTGVLTGAVTGTDEQSGGAGCGSDENGDGDGNGSGPPPAGLPLTVTASRAVPGLETSKWMWRAGECCRARTGGSVDAVSCL